MVEKEPSKKSWGNRMWARTGFGDKTVWDWLQLLIVPVILTIGGFWFTAAQEERQRALENARAEAEQKLEDQRAKVDRELQDQRAQQAILQSYLDQMGTLLLDRNLSAADEGSDVRNVARARTLTTLAALDPIRKKRVLRFLDETKLIQPSSPDGKPVISLSFAELDGVKLGHVGQIGAFNLKGVILTNADLNGARLLNADLTGADLRETDLSGADLINANLRGANLTDTDLTDADLSGADLTGAVGVTKEELEQQASSLEGATMPDGSKHP